MKDIAELPPATPESVWAAFRETDRLLKESRIELDQSLKKSRVELDKSLKKSRAEFDQSLKESRAAFDQRMEKAEREREKSSAEFDRRMKKLEESMGSWSNNHGLFAEEYFVNSFENGKPNFFGEKFDEMENNVKGIRKGFKDEYDILLMNGDAIGIVEIKFKAHENDIPKVLRKAETFRVNFPEYKDHRIYLGLATMAFYPELEQECIDKGIAVVKQVGETVVINDAHLKVF